MNVVRVNNYKQNTKHYNKIFNCKQQVHMYNWGEPEQAPLLHGKQCMREELR